MSWNQKEMDTLLNINNNDIAFNVLREPVKPRFEVTSVSCFSSGGDYICPYYQLPFGNLIKMQECNKCWGN